MKDQHTKIIGYRELSKEEIDLMNKSKKLASKVGELIEELDRIDSINKRWLGIAEIDIQKGFMSLSRSITESF